MTRHYEDPSIAPTIVVSLIFVLIVVATLFGLEAYFGRAVEAEFTDKVEGRPSREAMVLEEQRRKMTEYRWEDRDAGTVAIPVARAMELVVRDLSGGAR